MTKICWMHERLALKEFAYEMETEELELEQQ